MDTSSTPASLARRLVVGFAVAGLMALAPACGKPPTQIVLVVDTNLAKVDLDQVKITVLAPADPVDGAPTDAAADAARGGGGPRAFL